MTFFHSKSKIFLKRIYRLLTSGILVPAIGMKRVLMGLYGVNGSYGLNGLNGSYGPALWAMGFTAKKSACMLRSP